MLSICPKAANNPPGPLRRATRYDWLYLLGQVLLVAGIEVGDDVVHAVNPLANATGGLTNAVEVAHFEMAHGLWIEPAVQQFFTQTHYVLGQAIGWAQVSPVVDALYGQGHLLFTLSFATWIFFYRRGLFPFVRNVFLLTNLLAVALYEAFPLAPPRLAKGLQWDGHSWHSLDPVFGAGSGVKLSFNEFAAMPSLHVAWALIVGLSLAWAARSPILRVLGLIYPLIMLTTVIVTGNHYVSDALGAVVVVAVSVLCSVLLVWLHSGGQPIGAVLRQLNQVRHQLPPVVEELSSDNSPRRAAA